MTRPLLVAFIILTCSYCTATSRAADAGAIASKPGLLATYADANHRIVTLAATPDFTLKENESSHPQLTPAFTADWTGVLKIVKRAKYTIALDGAPADAKLTLDGNALSPNPIDLDIGDHAIQVHYTRKPGPARLQLVWEADFFAREPVPPSALAHAAEPPDIASTSGIEDGQRLVEELNCIACHHTDSKTLSPRKAPDLSTAGSRLHPEWIARWLENPRAFRHSAQMPTPPLKADDRRDIAVYLATLKDPNNKIKEQPQPSRMELGKQTCENVGCTACHGDKAVPLGALGSNISSRPRAVSTATRSNLRKANPPARPPRKLPRLLWSNSRTARAASPSIPPAAPWITASRRASVP
jgi:mono/diheme cytochrome c family protein